MAYCDDLLKSATKLLGSQVGRPQFSNCNRAVSTAYYSIFDFICRTLANRVCGRLSPASLATEQWALVHRSLGHIATKKCLLKLKDREPVFLDLAVAFSRLHEARIAADYDPLKQYTKTEASALIDEAKQAIKNGMQLSPDDISMLVVALLDIKVRE